MKESGNLSEIAQAICRELDLNYVAKIGEGAYKETFHVKTSSNEALALKVFKPGYHQERSEREIRAMRQCSHPNIAQLLSVAIFSFDGTDYLHITEEFLGGKTLTQHIERNGLIDRPSILEHGEQLIDAVSHIASHDFVHRDIKPDNILFRDDNRTPVIVDFGIVRDLSAESLTSSWLIQGPGTPLFAAPEQLNNEKELIDWRTDQFSLGVVLSISAFGIHPFDAGNRVATVQEVARRGSVSQDFVDNAQASSLSVLQMMVDPWPVNRYRTPEDLSKAWTSQERM